MISMCKKYWSRLKNKVCPALLSICLISCIASPFVSAADYSGTGSVSFGQYGSGVTDSLYYTAEKSLSMPFADVSLGLNSGFHHANTQLARLNYARIGASESDVFTSPVKLYLSVFAYRDSVNDLVSSFNQPLKSAYYNADTQQYFEVSNVEKSTFTPNFSATAVGRGCLMSASFTASPENPIFFPAIVGGSTGQFWYWGQYAPDKSTPPVIRVLSFRAVTTETSADLSALESIADSIVAQSEVLTAFYGDIVAVCNEIYSRLGDIQQTAELANVYFQQVIALLQSIEGTTVDIYNLLSTQFELLITAINTAATDIEAAIAAQTTALIAYFDSVFSGAVGNLPEKSDDLDTNIGNLDQSENEYKSDASAKFETLSTQFNGFTGGTLSGIALASNLFTQVWNALGEYSVVYSFPLLFGLCLLLIGRLSKHSGGQSSTDKERGDSDA